MAVAFWAFLLFGMLAAVARAADPTSVADTAATVSATQKAVRSSEPSASSSQQDSDAVPAKTNPLPEGPSSNVAGGSDGKTVRLGPSGQRCPGVSRGRGAGGSCRAERALRDGRKRRDGSHRRCPG